MALVAAAAIAGTTAAAAYIDGKYHIRKDLDMLRRLKKGDRVYQQALKDNRISLWYMFTDMLKKYGPDEGIWSRTGVYTWQEVHDMAARYGQWFLEQGIVPGDLVAIYLHNSAEFMMIWMGLFSIGCAPAFINYNLEDKALLHCLGVCDTKLLIVDDDPDLQKRVERSRDQIGERGTTVKVLDADLKNAIASRELKVPGDEYRQNVTPDFPAALIYTSGTTGLPKGCAFTTARCWTGAVHLEPSFGSVRGTDRWYICMPLYHGTGGMSAMMQLTSGVSLAIGKKFSVSRFWDDIHDSQSTFFVYVGETARYLLNAPPHPLERSHRLRCVYGNGMRPDVWDRFRARFNIPEIAEFFNSTEGMFTLINWDRGSYQARCVGHHGLIMRNILHKIFIPVRIDHDTGDIWRDPATGLAQRMPYTEGGEMVVAIPSRQAFQGYWKAQGATDKKYAADLFQKGDLYYRSGDALRRDDDGKWYFLDRLGDTFRWKSENVSTAEVAECLGHYPGIAEANVYGVLVPNHEGRAGCAAVLVDPNHPGKVDWNDVLRYARARLPKYAVPVFLRVVGQSQHIHNHKQNKVPLRKEGVDPSLIGKEVAEGGKDQLLWLPPKGHGYVEFGKAEWEELEAGRARL